LEKAGSQDLINRIAQLFFKNAPKLILIIQKSLSKLDAKMIQMAAHSLKSASSNLGAQRLSAMSNEIELLASKDKITDLHDRVRAMKEEYRRVKKALDIELERRNS
jgi:HPt (histidine-containing phosphotransfer) domain-containing protein